MRLLITLCCTNEAILPVNYQQQLAGWVYHLLEISDAEYSRFLHDEGYRQAGSNKPMKLFAFSWLRPRSRRGFQVLGDRLSLSPGLVDFYLASTQADFLTHSATGLLSAGQSVRIAGAALEIAEVSALPSPEFRGQERFTCLSPIVASVPVEGGGTYYLRPSDGEAFSEAVRQNLLRKHKLAYGEYPQDDALKLTFDEEYLSRDVRHGGTKKVTFKEIEIVGAYAPFTLTGSPELMRTAWDCGLGEKNSAGFGMVERQ